MTTLVASRIARYGGMGLQLCAFIFLGYVLVTNFARLRSMDVLRLDVAALMGAMTAVSVLMIMMLVIGWRELLLGAGSRGVPLKNVFWVIGRTAIAKYLPGNVFQYVGRQIFGTVLGAEQTTILAATLGEVMIVASVSCLIALASIPFAALPSAEHFPSVILLGALLAGAVSPIVFWVIAPWLGNYRAFRGLKPMLQIGMASWLRSFLSYGVCLLIGTAIFLMVSGFFLDTFNARDISTLIAAYSISYAFGFMIPGAPGGLGVREALIVLIAGTVIDQSVLVTVAIVQRLSSIFAEAICFGGTFFVPLSAPAVREG